MQARAHGDASDEAAAGGGFDSAVEVEGVLTGADLKISAQAAAYGLVIVGSQGSETLTGSSGHDSSVRWISVTFI